MSCNFNYFHEGHDLRTFRAFSGLLNNNLFWPFGPNIVDIAQTVVWGLWVGCITWFGCEKRHKTLIKIRLWYFRPNWSNLLKRCFSRFPHGSKYTFLFFTLLSQWVFKLHKKLLVLKWPSGCDKNIDTQYVKNTRLVVEI